MLARFRRQGKLWAYLVLFFRLLRRSSVLYIFCRSLDLRKPSKNKGSKISKLYHRRNWYFTDGGHLLGGYKSGTENLLIPRARPIQWQPMRSSPIVTLALPLGLCVVWCPNRASGHKWTCCGLSLTHSSLITCMLHAICRVLTQWCGAVVGQSQ
jgi:hypothetical protein